MLISTKTFDAHSCSNWMSWTREKKLVLLPLSKAPAPDRNVLCSKMFTVLRTMTVEGWIICRLPHVPWYHVTRVSITLRFLFLCYLFINYWSTYVLKDWLTSGRILVLTCYLNVDTQNLCRWLFFVNPSHEFFSLFCDCKKSSVCLYASSTRKKM